MDKLRNVLSEIQFLIESGKGATVPDLKNIWNNLSNAITESDDLKHTDSDVQEFAEWCSENGWKYYRLSKIWVKYVEVNLTSELTTSQLLEEFKVWKEANNG